MPLFSSFVALSGRLLRSAGKAPEWVSVALETYLRSGNAYSSSVSAEGIPEPTYSISAGALPNGLSLNSSSGAITGTPSVGGSFDFTITATNALGSVDQAFTRVVTLPPPSSVQFLIIAGGGGGGTNGGGGGGAGGYKSSVPGELSGRNTAILSATSINPGTNYSITVGGGGGIDAKGGNSSWAGNSCTGGGWGATSGYTMTHPDGGPGGSGGGGGAYAPADPSSSGGSGTTAQGYPGGSASSNTTRYAAAGGGGAGAQGQGAVVNAGKNVRGAGGAGLASSITGTSVTRAYGAGGNQPGPGVANYGNGGGGSYSGGGSGVVILRGPASTSPPTTIAAGLSYSSANSNSNYWVYEFTSGSGNVSWSP